MSAISLYKRLIKKNWRSQELTLLFLTLCITTALLASINLMGLMINRTITQRTVQFMGGNAVLVSSRAFSSNIVKQAKRQRLSWAQSTSTLSMLAHNNKMRLVSVLAVSPHYPLLGHLVSKNNESTFKGGIPVQNSIWVAPSLMSFLQLKLGDTVQLGHQSFVVKRLLVSDPVQSGGFSNMIPRALISLVDLPHTKLLLPGSRAQYRIYVLGQKKQWQAWLRNIKPILPTGTKFQEVKSRESIFKNYFNNIQRYYQLLVLFSVLLSAVAVSYSIYSFCQNNFKMVILLRTFGATRREMASVLSWQLIAIATVAVSVGIIAGLGLTLWGWGWVPVKYQVAAPAITLAKAGVKTVITVFFILIFYMVLHACHLFTELSSRLSGLQHKKNDFRVLASIVLCALVSYFQVQNEFWTFWFTVIIFGVMALVSGVWLALIRYSFVFGRVSFLPCRYAVRYISRHPKTMLMQALCIILTLFCVVTTILVRFEFEHALRGKLSATTPNYFVVNVSPEQKPVLQSIIDQHSLHSTPFYPIVRSRWVLLNGKPVTQEVPKSARYHNVLYREINLTQTSVVSKTNRLLTGRWPPKHSREVSVSVERGVFNTFHLKLGDRLTFEVGSASYTGVVRAVRHVDWASFEPNFYFILSGLNLNQYPHTYLLSILIQPQQYSILNEIQKKLPNVSLINLQNVLKLTFSLIDNLLWLVAYISFFCLLQGALILVAIQRTSMKARDKEWGLWYRAGAGVKLVRSIAFFEQLILSVLTATFVLILSDFVTWLICTQIFTFGFQFNWAQQLLLWGGMILGLQFVMVMFQSRRWLLLFSEKPQ